MKYYNILYDSLKKIDFNRVYQVDIFNRLNTDNKSFYSKSIRVKELNGIYEIIHYLSRLFYGAVYHLYQSLFLCIPIIHKEGKKIIFLETVLYSSDLYEDIKRYKNQLVSYTSFCPARDRTKNISFKVFFLSIWLTFKNRDRLSIIVDENFFPYKYLHKIYYFFYTSRIISEAFYALEIIMDADIIISFMEMCPTENLLCQISNLNNKNTVALIHGIGVVDPNSDMKHQYPVVHYNSSVCKNIFCWGEYHENIYSMFTNANKFIVGKPHMDCSLENHKIEDGIIFILESDGLDNENLLKLNSEALLAGIQTSVWYKPDPKILKRHGSARNGPLRKVAVGVKSSLLFQMGLFRIKVLVLDKSPLSPFLIENLVVHNLNDIILHLNDGSVYPFNIWNKFIKHTGDDCLKIFDISVRKLLDLKN